MVGWHLEARTGRGTVVAAAGSTTYLFLHKMLELEEVLLQQWQTGTMYLFLHKMLELEEVLLQQWQAPYRLLHNMLELEEVLL